MDTVVCAPDDGWRYHPKHLEKFPDINKLCNVASCWIYIRIGNIIDLETEVTLVTKLVVVNDNMLSC